MEETLRVFFGHEGAEWTLLVRRRDLVVLSDV